MFTHNEKTKMDTGGGNSPPHVPNPRSVSLHLRDDLPRPVAPRALLRVAHRATGKERGEMKNKPKPRTRLVQLEPIAVQMLDHVCKVEGLTREQALNALLQRAKDRQEAGQ